MAIGMCSTAERRGTHIHCNAILQTDYFLELLCKVKQSGTTAVKSSSGTAVAVTSNSGRAAVKSSSSEIQQANMTAIIAPDSCIINLQLLSRHIEDVTQHVATCSACRMEAQSSHALTIFGKNDRNGLASIMGCIFKGCGQELTSILTPKPLD